MKHKKFYAVSFFVIAIVMIGVFFVGARTAGACPSWFGCWNKSSYIQEQNAIEQNQSRLMNTEPLPYTNDSQERKNLIRRIKNFNNANKISYIYLYSWTGKYIIYDTVKGKVSAVDSSLTAQQQLVDNNGNPVTDNNSCNSNGCNVVAAPAADGSYGTNGQSIFYFNESGAYREWNGLYLLSDQPFTPQTQPDLVIQK